MNLEKNNNKSLKIILIIIGCFIFFCCCIFGIFNLATMTPEERASGMQYIERSRKQAARNKAKKEAEAKVKYNSPEAKEKRRKQKVKDLFSGWDGSCTLLVKHLKKNLHDPGSFKHVETKYLDEAKFVLIFMKYRAKNGFGSLRLSEITASIDLDTKQLTIITNTGL